MWIKGCFIKYTCHTGLTLNNMKNTKNITLLGQAPKSNRNIGGRGKINMSNTYT